MASSHQHTCCQDDEFKDCPCWTKEGSSLPAKVSVEGSLKITLQPGESKWYCMCGQSANFPWCDGSHKKYNEANGTKVAPRQVKNEDNEEKKLSICVCAHSKNRPFCDGTHRKVKVQDN
mmetsp:Transcript_32646/g.44829  ORF Transcript_32646/g.44829 Transcript_32646/m.44829 type:complete len:119 (-) Transcript_32646:44-400(-)